MYLFTAHAGYKKICSDSYGKKAAWVYKEHCWTIYEKVCKGYGYHKKCFPVPKQRCKQIPVKVGKKVGQECSLHNTLLCFIIVRLDSSSAGLI